MFLSRQRTAARTAERHQLQLQVSRNDKSTRTVHSLRLARHSTSACFSALPVAAFTRPAACSCKPSLSPSAFHKLPFVFRKRQPPEFSWTPDFCRGGDRTAFPIGGRGSGQYFPHPKGVGLASSQTDPPCSWAICTKLCLAFEWCLGSVSSLGTNIAVTL